MRAIAAAHRDIVKLETIGHTTLGKPIMVLKITNDARNTPDNTRIPVLYSRGQPRARVDRGRDRTGA